MRVNVYAEEMTDRVEVIEKQIDGQPTDAPAAAPVDTVNRFGIGAGGDGDSLVSLFFRRTFSKEEAFNLAAWLVALSGDRERFDQVLAAVLKT